MLFCPTCSNLLLVEATMDRLTRWYCQTCPYVCSVKHKLMHDVEIKKKQVDDVMGGEDSWKNAETVEVKCPKSECEGGRAFFQMFQTRSADEVRRIIECRVCGSVGVWECV